MTLIDCSCGHSFEPKVEYRHRLVCGDCTDETVVGQAMRGEKAGMLCTDPPWNVGWDYGDYDDDLSPAQYATFTRSWLGNVNPVIEDAYCFVAQSMKNYQHFHNWFPETERLFAECQNFVQHTPTGMQYAFNPFLVWRLGEPDIKPQAGRRDWYLAETSITKMTADKRLAKSNTATRWPPTIEYIVENFSSNSDIVLDPFAGSGTTAVACERLGRRARMIEISPAYCAVILECLSEMGLAVEKLA